MTLSRSARTWSAIAMATILTLGAVESAEARRGGSFGSRGMRTYQAPRATPVAPTATAPVQRSMTPRDQARPAAAAQRPAAANAAAQAQRGSFLRRWGGPILGGLLAAGLFGMLMGSGFGGAAGIMAMLLQVGLIALIAAAAFAFFRRRKAATAAAGPAGNVSRFEFERPASPAQSAYTAPAAAAAGVGDHDGDEIGVGQGDLEAFEQLLGEIQSAFGREDYAALRERTTPEIMSYMAEELSQNAVAGRRNDVTEVRLLQGDVSEAWREDSLDYATVAMRYSSIDVMRDRATGRLLEGEERPTETTEMWTFVRDRAGPWGAGWKLSAIQELQPA